PRFNHPRERSVVVVPVLNPRHAILEPLNGTLLLFPRPAPLRVTPGGQPGAKVMATPLLRTSRESWVEPDLGTKVGRKDPGHRAAPVEIAVAVTDRPAPGDTRPPPPRMVVFSSRDLGGNRYVQLEPRNLDLLMNAVNWLRGRPENIGESIGI